MCEYLLEQHGPRCQGCRRVFDDPLYLELDHNTPRSQGGLNHISNRMLLCSSCNRIKIQYPDAGGFGSGKQEARKDGEGCLRENPSQNFQSGLRNVRKTDGRGVRKSRQRTSGTRRTLRRPGSHMGGHREGSPSGTGKETREVLTPPGSWLTLYVSPLRRRSLNSGAVSLWPY